MVKVTKEDVSVHHPDVEKIWDSLGGFSSYSFNKSHALAYSMIAYTTARVYTYRFEEFLEYQLNNAAKIKFELALEKLKSQGYKPHFPSYRNMADTDYKVYSTRSRVYGKLDEPRRTRKFRTLDERKEFIETEDYLLKDDSQLRMIVFPAGEKRQYDDIKEAFFGENPAPGSAYLKGCFRLTTEGRKPQIFCEDRSGLCDLITTLPKKSREMMYNSPMNNATPFPTMLEMMKTAGVISDYEPFGEKANRGYKVYVIPFRGEPKLVTIRGNNDSEVILENIEYDNKYFGTTRTGLLGECPTEMEEIKWIKFQETLERRKELAENKWGKDWWSNSHHKQYYIDKAKDSMYEILQGPKYKARGEDREDDPKIYQNVRAIITDIKEYSRSVKVTFKFADKEDFYYIESSWGPEIKRLGKKSVVELDMYFNPFIQLRTGNYIEDYDILRITDVSTGKFLDKDAMIFDYVDDEGMEHKTRYMKFTDKMYITREDVESGKYK